MAQNFVLLKVGIGTPSALTAGAGELQAGLAGLAAVAVYYFCLWLLRGRLRNEYIFNIKK